MSYSRMLSASFHVVLIHRPGLRLQRPRGLQISLKSSNRPCQFIVLFITGRKFSLRSDAEFTMSSGQQCMICWKVCISCSRIEVTHSQVASSLEESEHIFVKNTPTRDAYCSTNHDGKKPELIRAHFPGAASKHC